MSASIKSTLRLCFAAAAIVLFHSVAAADATGCELKAGEPLIAALQRLNACGVAVSYSSALVNSEMNVKTLPTAKDTEGMLHQLLGPFRLKAIKSGTGWIVVRDSTTAPHGAASSEPAASNDSETIDQVIVTGSRYGISDTTHSAAYITREDVKQSPHLMDDAIRILKGLPGVSGGDFSAKLNVRGGRRDEVMLTVDGAEIHDGFHFSQVDGLLSAMDTNLVDSMDFITGGMTAEWSNYMSGVIDIRSRDPGIQDEFHNAAGISFISAFARTSGSFDDDKGSWLLAARRGYLDLLVNAVQDSTEQTVPRYEDVFSKIRYKIGDSTTISAHLLYGADSLNYSQDNDNTFSHDKAGSTVAWIAMDNALSDELNVTTTLGTTQVHQKRADQDYEPEKSAAIVDADNVFKFVDFRQDWQWIIAGNQMLRWGLSGSSQHGDYDYALQSLLVDPAVTLQPVMIDRTYNFGVSTWNAGAFAADRMRFGRHLTMEAGARFDKYHYPELPVQSRWSPRFNAIYRFDSGTEMRAAWGVIYQGQNAGDLQIEDGVTAFYEPEQVTQTVLGVMQPVTAGLTLRIDAYHKNYDDLHPRFENEVDPIEGIPEADVDRVRIDARRARSWGTEVTLRRDVANSWGGFLSYSYSKSEELDGGVWRPRSWDQRHSVALGVHVPLGQWMLSFAGRYHSGTPTTAVVPRVVNLPDGSQQVLREFGDRNALRLQDYSRIDMRIGRDSRLSHGVLSYYLEIINLLDQKNPCCFDINKYQLIDQPGAPHFESEAKNSLPLLPSFGIQYQF